jgi:hypothetical protein
VRYRAKISINKYFIIIFILISGFHLYHFFHEEGKYVIPVVVKWAVMPKINIEDIIEQRLEIIQTETPGLTTIYDIEESEETEWGVITITEEDGRPSGFEFIETHESLMRPTATDQYSEAATAVGRVVVIVPDSAYEKAADMLSRLGNPSIELVGYGVIGIMPLA